MLMTFVIYFIFLLKEYIYIYTDEMLALTINENPINQEIFAGLNLVLKDGVTHGTLFVSITEE